MQLYGSMLQLADVNCNVIGQYSLAVSKALLRPPVITQTSLLTKFPMTTKIS